AGVSPAGWASSRRPTGGRRDAAHPAAGTAALRMHGMGEMQRRYPVGAELIDGGVHFRVWAPSRRAVAVVIDGNDVPLDDEGNGYFSGAVETNATLYRFRLDGGDTFPD